MNILRSFSAWIAEVFQHWYGWAGGTAVAVVLLLGYEFFEWQPSRWQFITILAVGLVWSMFTAWSQEHDARLRAEGTSTGGLSASRPIIAPHRYGQDGIAGAHGLIIANDGYAAYDVSIPDVPVSDSGYRLTFERELPRLVEKDGKQFFEAWIEGPEGSGSRGSALFKTMVDHKVDKLEVPILYKDANLRTYRSTCLIERDIRIVGGLRVRLAGQEMIDRIPSKAT